MPPRQESLHEPLHAALHEPIREPLPDFSQMSDDDLLAYAAHQDSGDKYSIPRGFEPDGMSYQWKRYEVYQKPDYSNMATVEKNGWRSVPQERHDGYWMPPGTKGPVVVDGLMLMELPTRLLRAKEYLAQREAAGQMDSMQDRLTYSKPGSAPRDAHPKTKPVIRRETVQVQMEVAP